MLTTDAGDGAISWMWTLVELGVGIMTTCMPGMKMYITWMRGAAKPVEQQQDTIGGGRKLRAESAEMSGGGSAV